MKEGRAEWFKKVVKQNYKLNEKDKKFVEEIRNKFVKVLSPIPSAQISHVPASLEEYIKNFSLMIKDGNNKLIKTLSEEAKSREIFKNYEDDFLILVYGKVNTGKSTFANTIADYLKKMGLKIEYFRFVEKNVEFMPPKKAINKPLAVARCFGSFKDVPPEFIKNLRDNDFKVTEQLANWFEKMGKKIPIKTSEETQKISITRLEEDILESTTSIQGFRCGSIVWIDTPGIHSLTRKHEDLARYFATHANLLIFISSYDSPLRGSELDEILNFHTQKIPLFLIVSKCDKIEEKSKFGKLVSTCVRPPEDEIMRAKEYVWNVVKKSKLEGWLDPEKIIFLSSRLYREGKREESGVETFLEFLAKLMREEGSYLKLKTPLTRLAQLSNDILRDISVRGNTLQELSEKVKNISKRLDKLEEEIIRHFLSSYMNEVDKIIEEKRKELKSGTSRSVRIYFPPSKYKEILENSVRNLVTNARIEKEIKEILKDFEPQERGFYNDLEKITKTITRIETHKGRGGIWGEGTGGLAGSLAGGVLGAEIGAAIGGPVGAVIGGLIGGILGGIGGAAGGRKIGEEIGKDIPKVITEEIVLGENVDEVRKSFQEKGEAQVREDIATQFKNTREACKNLVKEIDDVIKNWEEKKKKILKIQDEINKYLKRRET